MEKRIVLVAAIGTSPAVLTETVWALAHSKPAVVPSQVVVITTATGRARLDAELLSGETAAWPALVAALKREKIPGADGLRFGRTDIRILPDANNDEADDIRSAEDSMRAADFMLGVVRQYTEEPNTVVYSSIAGGRKTMSSLLLSCMSLLGRENDKVFHVLTTPELPVANPRFYFPQKGARHVYKEIGVEKSVLSSEVAIELFEVPFVPIRGWFAEKFNSLAPTYAELVNNCRRQSPRAVVYPKIEIDFARKGGIRLLPEGKPVALSEMEFVLLCLLSRGVPVKNLISEVKRVRKAVDDTDQDISLLWPNRFVSSPRIKGASAELDESDLSHCLADLRKKLKGAGFGESEALIPKRKGGVLFPLANFAYKNEHLLSTEVRGYLLAKNVAE